MGRTANRFDFLRLVFAGMVALYHAVFLASLAPESKLENILAQVAELSIQGFFIISGALVLGSLIRSDKLGHYAEKRVRRLYPAYAVIILIPAVIALIMSGQFQRVMAYVLPNLAFLNYIEPALPGLFEEHRMPVVNGALWTLKIEVMFYITLPLIWWIMKRWPKFQLPVILFMIIGAEIWRYLFTNVIDHGQAWQLTRQLPGQMGYFAMGMYLWLNLDRFKETNWPTLFAGLFLVGLSIASPILPEVTRAFRPIGLTLVIGWIAFANGPALNAARYGDMSYGIYITHFPIIQACIALGLFAVSPVLGLFVSLGLTVLASFILWHWVEKPALLPSSHYRTSHEQN